MSRRRRRRKSAQKPVPANAVATTISIFDRYKLGAVQLLDRIAEYDDPAFLLVVSARTLDETADFLVPVECVVTSDPRMLSHMIDIADREHLRQFGQAGEDEVAE